MTGPNVLDVDSLESDFEKSERSAVDLVGASIRLDSVWDLLKGSAEFFLEFFLPEELTTEVPLFHKEVWAKLIDQQMERVLLAIPRAHAKTTLAKLSVVWYFLFTNHRFCVYLSNTNTIAKNACRDIMGYLKSDNFRSVFGDVRIIKESETESLWIFEIPQKNGKWKRCVMRAVGANQQMRGINIDNQRPDIAVIDDVEDNENTESESQQAKLDRWIYGPFIKALDSKRKKILWLGNMLQKTSLLARLSTNPKWNPVVFGSLIKNPENGEIVPLWPERWPLDDLVADFQEYVGLGLIETWMCEMMNMPGHGKNGFRPNQVYMQPKPIPGDYEMAFLVLDPAFGEAEINDNSSITVHVIRLDGLPIVAEHRTAKYSETELFDNMHEMALYWNAWVWGIEAIAAQRVLITLFNVYMSLKQIGNHIELVPLMSGRGDPKISRIRSFVGLMGEKEYAIAEDMVMFVTQMMNYNMTKKANDDDLLDSCAYGPQMMENYLGLIEMASNGQTLEDVMNQGRFGTEMSSV